MERFNLKKLNELEVKEQYHVEISNRFAVSENMSPCAAKTRCKLEEHMV
jgi:hypothetical protein